MFVSRMTPSPLPAVAQAIADGEPWLLAWTLQSETSYLRLSRESGVSEQRLDELYGGARPTNPELAALAKAWKADLAAVVVTLPAG